MRAAKLCVVLLSLLLFGVSWTPSNAALNPGIAQRGGLDFDDYKYFATLDPQGAYTVCLDINKPTDVIWAFEPDLPADLAPGQWAQWHEEHRGYASITFGTGVDRPVQGRILSIKYGHAAVMAIVWLIIFPVGVFYSRYLRFKSGWLWVHIGIQGIILGSYIPHGLREVDVTFSHHAIGYTLLGVTILQSFFGLGNRLGLQMESLEATHPIVRKIHDWTGRSLLCLGLTQAVLGLIILYPFEINRGREWWYIYVIVAALWFIIYLVSESYYQVRIVLSDTKLTVVDGKQMPGEALEKLPLMESHLSNVQLAEKTRMFTWDDIDNELRAG
ncbi:hypothetical protein HK102_012622 [Quaeritorhiza haematococci]|nr:hypothetical protein HK102_012622 [Quaeritorhiza haematococci]